jgi:hypothetical protein
MRRNGWSRQAPVRRVVERDEAAIELGKKEVRPQVERQPRLRQLSGLRVLRLLTERRVGSVHHGLEQRELH